MLPTCWSDSVVTYITSPVPRPLCTWYTDRLNQGTIDVYEMSYHQHRKEASQQPAALDAWVEPAFTFVISPLWRLLAFCGPAITRKGPKVPVYSEKKFKIGEYLAKLQARTRLFRSLSPSFSSALAHYDTIRYDTRCYFNVRSKADISRLNLPHGNDN